MATPRATTELVAIVLNMRNAGEGHRVLQLFDQTRGRVGVWARNARGSKRRFAGVLEPFYTLRLTAVAQGDLFNLHDAEVVCDRSAIRRSLAGIARAANVCNVVRALWPEAQAAPPIFDGLQTALDHVTAGRVARAAGLYPRLAGEAGYMPDLTACAQCSRPLPPMVLARGAPAVMCPSCAPRGTRALDAVIAGLRGERIEEDAAADAVERCILDWLAHAAGKPLAPWQH